MLNRVNLHRDTGFLQEPRPAPSQRAPASSFSSVLEGQLRSDREVKFSAHALQRLRDRGISLTASEKSGIARALDQAEAKGARDTLLLMDGKALVASVPNRTIITVVPPVEGEDTVFTNIDSAVVVGMKPADAA